MTEQEHTEYPELEDNTIVSQHYVGTTPQHGVSYSIEQVIEQLANLSYGPEKDACKQQAQNMVAAMQAHIRTLELKIKETAKDFDPLLDAVHRLTITGSDHERSMISERVRELIQQERKALARVKAVSSVTEPEKQIDAMPQQPAPIRQTEPQTENTTQQETAKPSTKDRRNGVTRPRPDTITGKVWTIADRVSCELNAPVEKARLLAETDKEGINTSTAATQYAKWRTYYGLPKPPRKSAQTDVTVE